MYFEEKTKRGFTFPQTLCTISPGDNMNQENRNYRSQSSRQDPYEKGFAHKLYENDIGPEPTYRGEQTA